MTQKQIKIVDKLWKRHSHLYDEVGSVIREKTFWKAFEEYFESFPLDEPVVQKFTAEEETILKALLVSKMMDFTYAISEHIFMEDKEKERLQKQLDSMQNILSKFSA